MRKHILVGIDETPESQVALHWAVGAAQGRGLPVRVIRAFLNELQRWPGTALEGYVPPEVPRKKFQRQLDEAVEYARDRLGYDGASGWLAQEDPATAILTEAPAAELVVLGSRSPNKLSAAFLGSVATAVAAKAPCPVVVVRHPRRTGSIVVGVDGSELSEDALAFAFEEAERTGQPVKAVHCWQPAEEAGAPATRQLREVWLADSLAPYEEKYPAVRARAYVVSDRPSVVLTDMSASASLVVVGSRGRGGVAGLLLGSVSQSLLHHAQSPVAIVRGGAG